MLVIVTIYKDMVTAKLVLSSGANYKGFDSYWVGKSYTKYEDSISLEDESAGTG